MPLASLLAATITASSYFGTYIKVSSYLWAVAAPGYLASISH